MKFEDKVFLEYVRARDLEYYREFGNGKGIVVYLGEGLNYPLSREELEKSLSYNGFRDGFSRNPMFSSWNVKRQLELVGNPKNEKAIRNTRRYILTFLRETYEKFYRLGESNTIFQN